MPKITSGNWRVLLFVAAVTGLQVPVAELPANVSAGFAQAGLRVAPSFQKHRAKVVRAELTGNGVEDRAVLYRVCRGSVRTHLRSGAGSQFKRSASSSMFSLTTQRCSRMSFAKTFGA